MRKIVLGTLLVAFSLCGIASANSITLISQSGGTYNYGLTYSDPLGLPVAGNITFSGLSGVTGISVSGNLATCYSPGSFTSTSAVFTGTVCGFAVQDTFGTLTITSTVTTAGSVQWAIGTSDSGTVDGPVAVPEPASLALMATGVVALLRRRKTLRL